MDIYRETLAIEDYLIRCRRHIHEHPELSDCEDETVAFVMAELTGMGMPCEHIAKGGILAFIDSGKPGKSLLLRADMDALPIDEAPCNTKGPKSCFSQVPGVAHLCGHDAHTAMLLGAAKLLWQHRVEFEGRVILMFERGEEAGQGGMHLMRHIQKNNVHIDGGWAIHVFPELPCGVLGLVSGEIFAGDFYWEARIVPDGEEGGDPAACAAGLINEINTIRMGHVSPFLPLTLSIGTLQYDGHACSLSGTVRMYDQAGAGLPAKRALLNIVKNTCAAYCCKAEPLFASWIEEGLLNDPTCCAIAREAVANALGQAHVSHAEPTMLGETFTAISSYYPSVMALLGIRDEERGITAPLHNPHFEANENALRYGTAAHVAYAFAFLGHKESIPFHGFQGDFDAFLKHREME